MLVQALLWFRVNCHHLGRGDYLWIHSVSPSRNPCGCRTAKHLVHAKREILALRYFDLSAEAIEEAAQTQKSLGS